MIIAQAHGFETYKTHVEGHFLNCENLDNYQAGIRIFNVLGKLWTCNSTSKCKIRRKRITKTSFKSR